MLFLLFIFYLLQYDDAQGLPVPIVDRATSPSTPETSIGKRSLFTIVWSCVSVVVICAWVSVHPNVPPRSQKGALLQRLRMMIWTIIAPELVLAWAVRQWFAARTVADRFKLHGWTMLHGHFLVMGGLTLVHADINMPEEPQKPIKDINRGDFQEENVEAAIKLYMEEEKQRYECYQEEKQRFKKTKRQYEGGQQTENDRRQYEGERRNFEDGRRRYEEFRKGYNLCREMRRRRRHLQTLFNKGIFQEFFGHRRNDFEATRKTYEIIGKLWKPFGSGLTEQFENILGIAVDTIYDLFATNHEIFVPPLIGLRHGILERRWKIFQPAIRFYCAAGISESISKIPHLKEVQYLQEKIRRCLEKELQRHLQEEEERLLEGGIWRFVWEKVPLWFGIDGLQPEEVGQSLLYLISRLLGEEGQHLEEGVRQWFREEGRQLNSEERLFIEKVHQYVEEVLQQRLEEEIHRRREAGSEGLLHRHEELEIWLEKWVGPGSQRLCLRWHNEELQRLLSEALQRWLEEEPLYWDRRNEEMPWLEDELQRWHEEERQQFLKEQLRYFQERLPQLWEKWQLRRRWRWDEGGLWRQGEEGLWQRDEEVQKSLDSELEMQLQWLEQGLQLCRDEGLASAVKHVLEIPNPSSALTGQRDIELRQCFEQELSRIQKRLQQFADEEKQRQEKEKEEEEQYYRQEGRYEDERVRYEEERRLYELKKVERGYRMNEADKVYEDERRQYEENRLSYEEKILQYLRRLRVYKAQRELYRLGPLSLEYFCQLLRESKIDFPAITAAEITDRSKGDFLSKSLAILQTTWFLLQCGARGVQGLPLTELELVTSALACVTAFGYAFWWHKPLGVQEPIKIYLKSEVMLEETPSDCDIKAADNNITVKTVWHELRGLINLNTQLGFRSSQPLAFPFALLALSALFFLGPFPLAIVFLLDLLKTDPPNKEQGSVPAQITYSLHSIHYQLTSAIRNFCLGRFNNAWNWKSPYELFLAFYIFFPLFFAFLFCLLLLLLPFYILLSFISFLFTSVFGIITTVTFHSGATQVPDFYAPQTKSDRYSRMLIFAIFGVTFGGLHCIGWYFKYPSHLEQTLWRVTSVIITVIPLIVAPIDFFLANAIQSYSPRFRWGLPILNLVMITFLFVYVLARLSLIAQALALLRHQPQGAFVAVDWTRYLPHFLSS